MITGLKGDDLGVPRIPECVVCEWNEDGKRVVFSYARLGNGITIHLAAKRDSLRYLDCAVEAFCAWIFNAYPWCEWIFAIMGRQSLERLAERCGFRYLTDKGPYRVFGRAR